MEQGRDEATQPGNGGDVGCNDKEDVESEEREADVEEDLAMSRSAEVSVGGKDGDPCEVQAIIIILSLHHYNSPHLE